ncbi:MAG: hypothetical protein HY901_30920 [Deltaproteobacteria bacterium]|nr:hypothetical protein [Deltaproteobacteria bacterium]
MPIAACTAEIGCAPATTGDRMVCAPEHSNSALKCLATTGEVLQPCGSNNDCNSSNCQEYRCCPEGYLYCDGNCVDVRTSSRHCGACGSAVPEYASCVDGAPRCGYDRTLCDGACVDLGSDDVNCGTCGTACGTEVCASDICFRTERCHSPGVCSRSVEAPNLDTDCLATCGASACYHQTAVYTGVGAGCAADGSRSIGDCDATPNPSYTWGIGCQMELTSIVCSCGP